MSAKPIILHVATDGLAEMEGKLFQAHVVCPGILKFIPCSLAEPDTRCPVIVGGEQCGRAAGHEGKHMWSDGD